MTIPYMELKFFFPLNDSINKVSTLNIHYLWKLYSLHENSPIYK